jgi:hypothetical protein
MPAFARQFEPQVTRSGDRAKFRFSVRCSSCARSETYEATKPVADGLVNGYFRERGWLLGRERVHDLCAACLAKPQVPAQARRSPGNVASSSPQELQASDKKSAALIKREKETADILARHLGKPEALAAEVFRPKEQQTRHATPPVVHSQPNPASFIPSEFAQAFMGLASDLKGIREAMEGISGYLGRLVSIETQQSEAVAGMGILLERSAAKLSEDLQKVVGTIHRSASLPQAFATNDVVARAPRPELDSENAHVSQEAPASKSSSGRRAVRPQQTNKDLNSASGTEAVAASVVVKSIPDANKTNRFYTSIRLPRDVWDAAGFNSDDRLLLDWDGQSLTVSRAVEGGVKPKAVGKSQVVLQSWKLGNLNFDKPRLHRHSAGFRLTARI